MKVMMLGLVDYKPSVGIGRDSSRSATEGCGSP